MHRFTLKVARRIFPNKINTIKPYTSFVPTKPYKIINCYVHMSRLEAHLEEYCLSPKDYVYTRTEQIDMP